MAELVLVCFFAQLRGYGFNIHQSIFIFSLAALQEVGGRYSRSVSVMRQYSRGCSGYSRSV
jgi:hypothetical protein